MSLDGKIARADGDVSWLENLPHPEGEDYGYAKFYGEIDTTIQGAATYREVLGFGVEFPYKDKTNYVITSDPIKTKDENVTFISSDLDVFMKDLLSKQGKDIWLIGGGKMNSLFLNNGWLDEMIIHVMPIVIGEGLPLFADGVKDQQMKLKGQKVYESGVIELNYKIK